MWINVVLAFIATVAVLELLHRSFVPSLPEVLRQRALAGQVFLIEPIADEGRITRCGCLGGLPARFNVSGGWGANGLLCVNCVRVEFARWLVREMLQSIPAHKNDGAPGEEVGSQPSTASGIEGS